jgi:parallel beta helix pectate lyase-like protein
MKPVFLAFSVAIVSIAVAPPAFAQYSRTAVSVNGFDTNPCTPASPCRNFAAAMMQTNPGGEVVALDSGGYGPFTVDRSITVIGAPGVYAGVTAASSNGIVVNVAAGAKVVLRNLYLNGSVSTINAGGSGFSGIAFTGGSGSSSLNVENLFIQGFSYGIATYFPVRVDDTRIHNCYIGFYIDNAGAATRATLNRVTIKGSGPNIAFAGVDVYHNATVVIRDSVIAGSDTGLVMSFGAAEALLENTMVVQNAIFGVDAGTGVVRLSNCMIADNVIGVYVEDGAAVQSWGNNRIRGNSSNNVWAPGTGTFTTVTAN